MNIMIMIWYLIFCTWSNAGSSILKTKDTTLFELCLNKICTRWNIEFYWWWLPFVKVTPLLCSSAFCQGLGGGSCSKHSSFFPWFGSDLLSICVYLLPRYVYLLSRSSGFLSKPLVFCQDLWSFVKIFHSSSLLKISWTAALKLE